jgi:DNA-directed RNA polymerase subunit RPC12/RpoP
MMVCPDCGSNRFQQTRVAQIEVTMIFDHGQWLDRHEEVMDSGERDADIVCDDCGREIDDADLVTEDDYNLGDAECDGCGLTHAECREGGEWACHR